MASSAQGLARFLAPTFALLNFFQGFDLALGKLAQGLSSSRFCKPIRQVYGHQSRSQLFQPGLAEKKLYAVGTGMHSEVKYKHRGG